MSGPSKRIKTSAESQQLAASHDSPLPETRPSSPAKAEKQEYARSFWDGWDTEPAKDVEIDEGTADHDRNLVAKLNKRACADGNGLFLWVDKGKWIEKMEAKYGTSFGKRTIS